MVDIGYISEVSVSTRLKDERTRLKLGQDQVASACGVTRKTFGRWENDTPIPSDKLEALILLGFDACYIVTGVKVTNDYKFPDDATAVHDLSAAQLRQEIRQAVLDALNSQQPESGGEALNDEEQHMLSLWRTIHPEVRGDVMGILESAAEDPELTGLSGRERDVS